MLQDLRYAIRLLRRSPGFAAAAVLTLALGIGATTAVYSVFDAVLLKPLPFDRPERVVRIGIQTPVGGIYGVHGGTLAAVRQLPAIEHAAVFVGAANAFLDPAPAETIQGANVSAEFFSIFGVQPTLGRTFVPVDDGAGARLLVLSESLWRSRFGGDPAIVNRAIRLNDGPYTIVGVMPDRFRVPEEAAYWRLYHVDAGDSTRLGIGPFWGYARLRDGSLQAARTQAAAIVAAHQAEFGADRTIAITPLAEMIGAPYASVLTLLLASVGLVLLTACANVANLLLSRTTVRSQELAIRAAIGATRGRLLRELLTESALVATAAAVVGSVIAWMLVRMLPALGSLRIPRIDEATVDMRVLTVAILTAVASVAVFGLVPAWVLARRPPAMAIERTTTPRGVRQTARALVALEIAVTLTLLVGAGLTLSSLYRLVTIDTGFDGANLTGVAVRPSIQKYRGPLRGRFFERVIERLAESTEVESVAAISHVPLARVIPNRVNVVTEGAAPETRSVAALREVSAGLFRTLGAPILQGREFTAADGDGAPVGIVVNDLLAQKLWKDGPALGRSLTVDDSGRHRSYRVIGVARAFRSGLGAAPQPEVYVEASQHTAFELSILVRSRLDPASIVSLVGNAVAAEDPEAPIATVWTMRSAAANASAYHRFNAVLLALFGLFATLLAGIGVFAVVLSSIARRTREIGVRVALGADPHRVVRFVLKDVLPAIGIGIAAGLVGIYNLSFLLARQRVLFEVRPFDPPTYAVVTTALAAFALFAAWLPARRASRIDPIVALRTE